jgi:hypothetical protein
VKKALVIAVLLVAGFVLTHEREVTYGPGVVAPDTPVQVELKNQGTFAVDEYRILPLAQFDLTARILSRKKYGWGREADLSPVDFALGWGRMSDEAVLDRIKISQSGRWYHWRSREMPIPRGEISKSSANMHLIPANEAIEDILLGAHKGEVVELSGKLVLVTADDGWRWKSSLTRNDTGNHACEVFYVEQARVKEVL